MEIWDDTVNTGRKVCRSRWSRWAPRGKRFALYRIFDNSWERDTFGLLLIRLRRICKPAWEQEFDLLEPSDTNFFDIHIQDRHRTTIFSKEGYFFNPALTLQTTSWQKCARERSAAFALLKKRIGDEKKVSMLRFQRKTLLDQFYATIVANGLISPFSRGIFRCKRAPITLALLTGKKNSRRVKRITSSSIPREEHPFPEALSYPWMGARGRKPDQRRERGAHCRHASFPWCAFRSSVASVACCSISTSHCADASKPPSPPQDTYVFTKGVARREGAVFLQTELALCTGLYLCNARPSPIRTVPSPLFYSGAWNRPDRDPAAAIEQRRSVVVDDRARQEISAACKLSQRFERSTPVFFLTFERCK